MYKFLAYCLLLTCLLVQGCKRPQKKVINWNVNLANESKDPYGSYLAFQSLKNFFPGTAITTLSKGFKYNNIDYRMKYPAEGRALLILTGLGFNVSKDEFDALLSFVRAGNEIVLFTGSIDEKFEEEFGFNKPYYASDRGYENMPLSRSYTGEENINCIAFATDTTKKYGYRGRYLQGSLDIDTGATLSAFDLVDEQKADTTEYQTEDMISDVQRNEKAPEILGYTNGSPNLIRYSLGGGHITIHAAPLVTSNYFLLQKDNLNYLQAIWNLMPEDISHVYWNSFYKHRAEHSDFGILWRHPATRWALILSIIALLLYVLLEMKRRQDPIPVIKPLENTSVTFVETVGRLYYNKGNHQNLAEKMVQHFLEWVRSHYYLNTNHLDDAFARSLSAKSGLPPEIAANLIEMIEEVKAGNTTIDEPYLYHLNNTIQRFYKNQRI